MHNLVLFYVFWPTPPAKELVFPAFVSVYSWAGGVFTSGRVNMACGFVAARGAVVFVSDAMAVGGKKSALDPL